MHPAHASSERFAPLPRRLRERVAGSTFETVTRIAGLRPTLMPEHMLRQLRILGVSDTQLGRVLPRLRSLGDWPHVWEAEADAAAAQGDAYGAFAALYVAQRVLLAPTRLKERIYARALDAYQRVEQPPLERLRIANDHGDEIAGYLQLPLGARTAPHPVVLMLPGVTGTKEELHPYAMPLLRRGYAVARIDHQVYGETTGTLDAITVCNGRHVLDALRADPRIDAQRMHLHGMSMGAHFALHAAQGQELAGIILICPPFRPGGFMAALPTNNLTAIQHMTGLGSVAEIIAFGDTLDLSAAAPNFSAPMRIFHGGRDRTVPASEGVDLARATGGPVAFTMYERDHHNCLEHTDDMIAQTLEFLHDPARVCASDWAIERVDEPATLQATDHDAALVGAGLEPSRRRLRIPFSLPGSLRARSRGIDT
ncbi:MAG: alpha/beta hydrolase [Thermoleophilia bacterium]|nr:alpha/beta hydrolase [Thermoleophilia bacterium]